MSKVGMLLSLREAALIQELRDCLYGEVSIAMYDGVPVHLTIKESRIEEGEWKISNPKEKDVKTLVVKIKKGKTQIITETDKDIVEEMGWSPIGNEDISLLVFG
jgi:hypothetical protein